MLQDTNVRPRNIDGIDAEVLAVLGSGRQIAPFSATDRGLTLADAYRVSARLERARNARGEKALGRKIGFTNRTIWAEYGVFAPIWGYVTDRSVHALEATAKLPLAGFAEPRIEPEIVFGLAAAPEPGMDEAAIAGCIGWVAHGYEIVQSIFPQWKFAPADTVAANALHAALVIGPRHEFKPRAGEWLRELATFDIELYRNGTLADRGNAANVLDSPVSALRHLVGLLADDGDNPPLKAGEIVSTGTLTRALPVAPGEVWHTRLSGIPLAGITLEFA
jgi:2-oxo-3-hexenedioate decarboxylase